LENRNWTLWKKSYLMVMIAIISTLSPLGSTLVSPGINETMSEFGVTSQITGTFMITIYVLGFGVGPLFLGPLSEMYGRYPVVILSTWFFNAWIMGSALAPSMGSLIAMRLFAGIGGSGVMTIAPAIIADMFPVEKRAFTTSIIVLAQCVGPAIGPLAGAFVIAALGWRWVSSDPCLLSYSSRVQKVTCLIHAQAYWVLLICAGTTTVFLTFFMHESYAPVLLRRKKERLSKESGRADLKTHLDRDMSTKQYVLTSMVRPMKVSSATAIQSGYGE
jgi:MFS family permease